MPCWGRDLQSGTGTILLRAGTRMSPKLIGRLKNLQEIDPSVRDVWLLVRSLGA